MLKHRYFLLLLLVVFFTQVFCVEKKIKINGLVDDVLHKQMLEVSRHVGVDNYVKAKKVAEDIIDRLPDHPVGYFLMAAMYDSKMLYYANCNDEKKLVQMCDKAIEMGERLIARKADDLWARFFIGGAKGYKGNFDMRYKRYITAFRNGLASVDILKEIHKEDEDFIDVLFGLGYYNYFSSTMAKVLWWMPGVSDNRELGIQQMQRVIDEGNYARIPASVGLISIFIDENRAPEALILAKRMIKEFPGGRLFVYALAKAAFANNDLILSEKNFVDILDRVDSDKKNNFIWNVRCSDYLSRLYLKNKKYIKAAAYCRRGLRFKFNEIDGKIVEDHISSLEKTLKKLEGKY